MPIILRPNSARPSDLDQHLEGLDYLAQLGAKTDHPRLKKPRQLAERLPALRQAAADLYRRQDIGAEIAAAAVRFLAGELTTAQLPAEAAAIDACGAYDNTAGQIIDRAQRNIDNEVADGCRTIGDLWLTDILRPAVQRTMEAATPELLEDAWTAVNTSRSDHTRRLRDALEAVEDIIGILDQLADVALQWRNFGWVPTPPRDDQGGWHAEGFRWLHHDRLGDPQRGTYAAFWLAGVRDGADHGIFTCDEILQANAAKPEPAGKPTTTGPENLTFAAAGV